MNVKALKNFYGTGQGSVHRGQVIDVSDASAKAMIDAGLVEKTSDPVGPAPESNAKAAPTPQNKMETGRRTQSVGEEKPATKK